MRKQRIEELIRLVEESKISELEIWEGKKKIRISKGTSLKLSGGSNDSDVQSIELEPQKDASSNSNEDTKLASNLREIKSPMVGTFYRTPAPGAEPFIEVGQRVAVGQTICIVEAMKLMNEIGSDYNGIIRKIYIENAQPVEYGQPLFAVEVT